MSIKLSNEEIELLKGISDTVSLDDNETVNNDKDVVSENTKDVSILTDYDINIIVNILKASRLVLIDKLAGESLDSDELLKEVTIKIPYYGNLLIKRLGKGRSSSLSFRFDPTNEFLSMIKNAMYKGKSPLINIATNNFNNYIDNKLNLLKDIENIQEGVDNNE